MVAVILLCSTIIHTTIIFEIVITGLKGKQDWEVKFAYPLLGFGKSGWVIVADTVLKQDLLNADVIDLVATFGRPTLAFNTKKGNLQLSEDVTPAWTPAREKFKEELEVLLKLITINQRVNAVIWLKFFF